MIKNGTYSNDNSKNNFSNSHKTKMIAGAVYNEVPYLKKAHSYMTQGELEGKKYGRTYSVYIPDPGHASNGLDITNDIDNINEIEVAVELDNIKTGVELTAWNKLTDEDNFRDEIAKPKGIMLGRALEKSAIDKTIFDAAQIAIGAADFATLSEGAGKLDEVGVAGQKVSFVKPTVMSKIANSGLAKFIPADKQKEIYQSKYLGEYATASQIEEALLPVVDYTSYAAPSNVQLTPIYAEDHSTVVGYEPVTNIGATTKGWAFGVTGVKIVDKSGMWTDQDRVVIAKNAAGDIAELRIAVEGQKPVNNPNAWVPAGFGGQLVFTLLKDEQGNTLNGEFYVGQVRTETALGFDTYKFDDLPGSENETQDFQGISVKMSQYGDGKTMQTLVRLDIPHAVCLPDAREAVVMLFHK